MTKKEKEIVRDFAHALTRLQDSKDMSLLSSIVVNSAHLLWQLNDGDFERAESDLKVFELLYE